MFETLTKSIFKITCGSVEGTCFLIDKKTAITAFHVVVEHNSADIILSQNCEFVTLAVLNDSINEECKIKDFAILTLSSEIELEMYLQFSVIENIEVGARWISRGYPKVKSCNGENIIPHADNSVHQHLEQIASKKIDVELNHNQKWTSYKGMSGAPLIISGKVVGIINSEVSDQSSKELCALSVKSLREILNANNIECVEFDQSFEMDISGAKEFEALKNQDIRSLPEKLKNVCNSISSQRITYYCRQLASGKSELSRYRDQDISATKYRIFEVCQMELLKFIENNKKAELEISDIDALIEMYSIKASLIIEERSKDYTYPLKNKDILQKIVLDLINECFLSFDEQGIYEG